MVAEGKPAVANTSDELLVPSSSRTVLPLLAAVALILIAILILGHEIERHVEAIESWMAHLGYWGVLAFVGFFVIGTSLFVPDTILCIAAGALFGLTRGFGAVMVGSLLASALQYGLAHFLLRAPIERTLATRRSFGAIQRAVLQDELRLQVLLRLTPLNPATVSYLLGAAGVRLSRFLVACLALAPTLFIEVYFGQAGKHVVRMASGLSRTLGLQDLVIIAGLAAGIFVIILISNIARRAVMEAVAESETRESHLA